MGWNKHSGKTRMKGEGGAIDGSKVVTNFYQCKTPAIFREKFAGVYEAL